MIKKISTLITLGFVTFCMPLTVKASDLSTVSTAATTTAAVAETGKLAYESSVISRMAGRCGASTQTGAKGIAFEIMYTDMKNLEHALDFTEKNLKTKLTNCANASTVDVYTIDEVTGNITNRFQLKNTPSKSGTNQVIKAVESGKYQSAKLVGTTESAEAFNSAAVKKSINKVMIDSGISVDATESVANRALGNTALLQSSLKSAAAGTAIGTAISGGFALAESIINGDDAYETTANVATDATVGGIAGGTSTLIACGASEILTALGASGAVATVTPVVICIGSAAIVTYVVEGIIDDNGFKEIIADYTQKSCQKLAENVEIVKVKIAEADIPGNTVKAVSFVTEKIKESAEVVKSAAIEAGNNISDNSKILIEKCQVASN